MTRHLLCWLFGNHQFTALLAIDLNGHGDYVIIKKAFVNFWATRMFLIGNHLE
jgi:hypothetical protein